MATAKKALLIEYELDFLDKQLAELKEYIEANPYSTLTDRMQYKETKNNKKAKNRFFMFISNN